MILTFLDKYNLTPIADLATVNDCAGAFGRTCGEPKSKTKTNITIARVESMNIHNGTKVRPIQTEKHYTDKLRFHATNIHYTKQTPADGSDKDHTPNGKTARRTSGKQDCNKWRKEKP